MADKDKTEWTGRTWGEKPKIHFWPPVRVTAEDAAWIKQQANERGMTVGAIIHNAVTGQPPKQASLRPTLDQKLAAKILADGGRIGGLLNQIAKSVNYKNEVIFQDTLEVWKEIKEYRDDLKKLIVGAGRNDN